MYQKLSLFILLLGMIILTACHSGERQTLFTTTSDSLSVQIKRAISEKKRVLALKRELESVRYRKSLLKYQAIIRKYAKRYGFDWRLIVAQIMQESKFREAARSPVGASGLMQLMPRTSQEITRELDFQYILKNPRENIAAGIYHLRKQYGHFPNADFNNRLKLSLASYNCGAGRVFDSQRIARHFKRPPFQWRTIRGYLQMLKHSDWEMHLLVWPQGKPEHGYFYGFNETITYVDNIWQMYQAYKKIL
jgi:membrane-bound lytic murein transglycosylase F